MSVTIKYYDIAVSAKEYFEPSAQDKQLFVDMRQLKYDGLQFENYSTVGELNQTLLNNSQIPFPDVPENENMGLWSIQLSDHNGNFGTPIVLTLTSPELFSSQGFTLTFDEDTNQYCNHLKIQWYRNELLLHEQDFYPDTPSYFCARKVETFNKAVITFYSVNMPYAYLKLRSVDFGLVRRFREDELAAVNVIEELDPISTSISVNTMDFTLVSKQDIDFMFQSKQPLELRHNGDFKGIFFIDGRSERLSKNKYKIKSSDYAGIIKRNDYKGGIYNGIKAYEILDDILLSVNVPYKIDPGLRDLPLYGYIPITSSLSAVMQVVFALGAVADTSTDGILTITTVKSEVSAVFEKVGASPKILEDDKLTEFQLVEHGYIPINEISQLYDYSKGGSGNNISVLFSEPHHSLAITNGTILSSGSNYAYINAGTNCILTGKRYNHTQRVVVIKNPLVELNDLPYVIKIENATLISKNNSSNIANLCYNYYIKRKSVVNKVKITNNKVGDYVGIDTGYLGTFFGNIESLRYSLVGNDIVAEAFIR